MTSFQIHSPKSPLHPTPARLCSWYQFSYLYGCIRLFSFLHKMVPRLLIFLCFHFCTEKISMFSIALGAVQKLRNAKLYMFYPPPPRTPTRNAVNVFVERNATPQLYPHPTITLSFSNMPIQCFMPPSLLLWEGSSFPGSEYRCEPPSIQQTQNAELDPPPPRKRIPEPEKGESFQFARICPQNRSFSLAPFRHSQKHTKLPL